MKKKLLLGLSLVILSSGGQQLKASEVESDTPLTKSVACTWYGSAGKNTDGINTCKTVSGQRVETRTWENGYIVQKVVFDTNLNKWDYRYTFSSTNGNKKMYQDWNNGSIIQEVIYNPSTNRVNEKTFWNNSGTKLRYETWSYGTIDTRTTYYSNGNRNVHTIFDDGKTIQENTYLSDKVDTKNFYTTSGVRTKYEDWNNGTKVQLNNYSNGKVTNKTFWNTSGTKTKYELWDNGYKKQVDYYTAGKMAYRDYYTNGNRTSRKSYENWSNPLPNSYITCEYGYGCYKDGKKHTGVDFQTSSREGYIKAVASGKVVSNDYQAGGYGHYITIDHGNGYFSLYGHMIKKSNLTVGQYITKGQYIGTEGDSGNVSGIHLHFEVREGADTYKHEVNPFGENLLNRSLISRTYKSSQINLDGKDADYANSGSGIEYSQDENGEWILKNNLEENDEN